MSVCDMHTVQLIPASRQSIIRGADETILRTRTNNIILVGNFFGSVAAFGPDHLQIVFLAVVGDVDVPTNCVDAHCVTRRGGSKCLGQRGLMNEAFGGALKVRMRYWHRHRLGSGCILRLKDGVIAFQLLATIHRQVACSTIRELSPRNSPSRVGSVQRRRPTFRNRLATALCFVQQTGFLPHARRDKKAV